jgi:predicted YcjX-like family ATPase
MRNGRARRWRRAPRRRGRRSRPNGAARRSALDAKAPASEDEARRLAELFTGYLKAARAERYALSTLPPGRFLMPGDLEGSPALTFAPLPVEESESEVAGSLAAMMARRYEAYKTHVVRPFFRDHFARLDRQIVLVDALAALNSGPAAVRDLENALADVLTAFRAGRSNLLTTIFRPRIDKILFAATKADHLHHTSHDRLEAILRHLVGRAIARAEGVGAAVDVVAMAAARATREAAVQQGRKRTGDRQTLDAIVGTRCRRRDCRRPFRRDERSRDLSGRIAGRSARGLSRRDARRRPGRSRLSLRALPAAGRGARRQTGCPCPSRISGSTARWNSSSEIRCDEHA